MSVAASAQSSLYETTIENPDLEAVLETRLKAKEKAGQARKAYKEADDQAKAILGTLDLGEDAPVRVGRFVITRKPIAARVVNFETEPSSRVQISLLPEAT